MGCTILKSRKLMKAVKYEGIGACDSGIYKPKCTVSVPPYGRWANAILTMKKTNPTYLLWRTKAARLFEQAPHSGSEYIEFSYKLPQKGMDSVQEQRF